MNEFDRIAADSIRDGSCLLLVLSKPRNSASGGIEKLTFRPVPLQGRLSYQVTLQHTGRHTHENLTPASALERVQHSLAHAFRDCHLFTVDADYSARVNKDGTMHFKKSQPTQSPTPAIHDRAKKYLIPEDVPCPFLIETGIMTRSGKVRSSKYPKFRQINRFLELVDDVLPFLPQQGHLHVVDFGCGKSYLTFALHHLLSAVRQRRVSMTGLDVRTEVVQECGQIAERLDVRDIDFQIGEIACHETSAVVDMAVSLHACDTATDAALAKAVSWGASVILAVPCCQHELVNKIAPAVLPPLQRQGILKERFATLVTDALRAQALEICGYKTQVIEFIDMEHTAKNVLIRAVRRETQPTDLAAKVAAYVHFKQELGLGELYLEEVLGVEFARVMAQVAPAACETLP